MKKVMSCSVIIIICLFMGNVLWALDNDVKAIPACKYCGMNREMFAHSRMLTGYDTGSEEGTCSLHCAAIDMALSLDKTPTSIQVGDYGTKKLIDAEKATWIIGGSKPGVMTRNAKWAFADKSDAEKFQQANGGRLATFDEALQASYQDLGNDIKMIREKRKMKKIKMNMEHKH